jgi:hypothetical protein
VAPTFPEGPVIPAVPVAPAIPVAPVAPDPDGPVAPVGPAGPVTPPPMLLPPVPIELSKIHSDPVHFKYPEIGIFLQKLYNILMPNI